MASQNAKATVTAIIDGTGSLGAAVGPLLIGVITRNNQVYIYTVWYWTSSIRNYPSNVYVQCGIGCPLLGNTLNIYIYIYIYSIVLDALY